MWFKKKEEKKSGQVKCNNCRHWIDSVDAQVVLGNYCKEYYCMLCKKPYDVTDYEEVFCKLKGCKKEHNYDFGQRKYHYEQKYYKNIPATRIEVNENGEPIM